MISSLLALRSESRAAISQRFFRTGKGDYGYGDKFLGIANPQVRQLVKTYDSIPLSDIHDLLMSEWHEARLCGVLILSRQFGKLCTIRLADDPQAVTRRDELLLFYLSHAERINNWDLVDLSVPDDLVILGTDNEEELCESISPTLSSLALDFESAGKESVRILQAMINGTAYEKHQHFGVLKIVQRASTRRSPRTDNETRNALDFIREKCAYGITSKDVLGLFTCSRRTAESRFHALTGHSILEEIHIQRIEQAKKLIRNPTTKLSLVATMCGFRSNPFFARVFRRITGQTMQEWRAQNC